MTGTTPKDRIQRTMRAQLQHDAWRQYRPEPPPEPRRFADAMTALAVLSLSGLLFYLLADAWSWTDLRDGLALLWEAL